MLTIRTFRCPVERAREYAHAGCYFLTHDCPDPQTPWPLSHGARMVLEPIPRTTSTRLGKYLGKHTFGGDHDPPPL